jgi:hypothetical protein
MISTGPIYGSAEHVILPVTQSNELLEDMHAKSFAAILSEKTLSLIVITGEPILVDTKRLLEIYVA